MGKKRERVGGLRTRLDPAVREWLNDAAENPAALTAKQRWDRKRKKATYDLPPQIIKAINIIAQRERCSASNLVAVLLLHGLRLYGNNEIDVSNYARFSHSPRFENTLRIPMEELKEILDRLQLNKETEDLSVG